MASAYDVAQYILWYCGTDEESHITNLKLQKLLYYCQGFHLAILNRELFPENMEKWTHGPVVPAVYHAFKELGSNNIPKPDTIDDSRFEQESVDVMDEVLETYGQYTASALRNLSHQEPPWRDTETGAQIPKTIMKEYFNTLIE